MTDPILAVSRRTRRTPFTEINARHGVTGYTVYNHMLLPTGFRGVEADYRHLLENVQLWDVVCERQVELAGPDAARLCQLMTPRDLTRAETGQCLYAPLVDEDGGMVNDPVILKLAEDRFWLSLADSDVLLWAKGLAYGLGLDVAVTEPDIGPLAVQGPRAEDLVASVLGEAVRAIRFFRFDWLAFEGHPFLVARSGWSKQGGFEIYIDDAELGRALWHALEEAGKPFDVGPGCPNLIERIEGGLLSYGNDMTRANTPFECNLDRWCHLDRPIDFIARPALERLAAEGPRRRVRGLVIDGGRIPACTQAWPVAAGGGFAGEVTSAAFSPRLDAAIAFAMMEKGNWETGTAVTVATPDGERKATVADLPFV